MDLLQVFHETLSLPREKQLEFVRLKCNGDLAKQSMLLELVHSHQENEASGFLLDRLPAETLQHQDRIDEADHVGTQIGPYKLLEVIGEGGMGVVFMAEQTEGVRRRVALKIIKLGMDTKMVVARFEAERQAMAMFDHPNITKVLDAGTTSAGRPYFVMELVRGTGLSTFVKDQKADLKTRLSLLLDICRAVQHAHQKGVIHRDLKPSNVLVTIHDGVPVPKVIDFGIAKAIGQNRLTDKTLFTRFSATLGTPQYMSPEQAEMTGLDVDTRSDVYSLGAILYELVTDTTPIRPQVFKTTSPLALHETIRNADIETPSSRIQTSLPEGSTLRKEVAQGFGELDWVIMKALSRDRRQRYESASELAADVNRYLQGEPVLAIAPSRMRKWIASGRRHFRVLASLFMFTFVLSSVSVLCVFLAVKNSKTSKKLAEKNRVLAENVQLLEKTRQDLRSIVVQQKYDAAISLAIAKFDSFFVQQMEKIGMELFEDVIAESNLVKENNQEDSYDEDQSLFGDFDLCFMYDFELVLQLSNRDLVKAGLERIEQHIQESEKFSLEVMAIDSETNHSTDEDDWLAGGHQHSPECLLLQKTSNQRLIDFRPKFFRLLVDEYRIEFGSDAPEVAEALQMLAIALIQSKNYSEAEARLREAAVLGDQESKAISNRLRISIPKNRLPDNRAKAGG